jgi:hypothetical protein
MPQALLREHDGLKEGKIEAGRKEVRKIRGRK